jgi:hypothetical protein
MCCRNTSSCDSFNVIQYNLFIYTGPCIRNIDEAMLLLKATAQATIYCLSQCLSILQQQQIAPAHTFMPMPSGFHTTTSVVSSGGGVLPRKISAMHPVQYDDYDSKKRYVVSGGFNFYLVIAP